MGLKAGWYPQDDGSERYWDGERWTDAFRSPTGSPAPVEDAGPAEAANTHGGEKKTSGGVGCLAWVAGAVLLSVAFGLKGCGSSDSGSDETDKYAVQVTCQDIVEDQLKNPSTADFSQKQQTSVSASGLVTAENALGGKVTYAYRCSASGDTVKLESLTQR